MVAAAAAAVHPGARTILDGTKTPFQRASEEATRLGQEAVQLDGKLDSIVAGIEVDTPANISLLWQSFIESCGQVQELQTKCNTFVIPESLNSFQKATLTERAKALSTQIKVTGEKTDKIFRGLVAQHRILSSPPICIQIGKAQTTPTADVATSTARFLRGALRELPSFAAISALLGYMDHSTVVTSAATAFGLRLGAALISTEKKAQCAAKLNDCAGRVVSSWDRLTKQTLPTAVRRTWNAVRIFGPGVGTALAALYGPAMVASLARSAGEMMSNGTLNATLIG